VTCHERTGRGACQARMCWPDIPEMWCVKAVTKTEVTAFAGGVWMEQHGCVLSKVLAQPGPTHSVFDVLAAAVVALSPGPRVAMLGFAGGGMMAPLRKMGGAHAVSTVDLDDAGFRIYSGIVDEWGEELEFAQGDAVRWLRGQRRKYDAIVEDLSVPTDGDVVKPEVSWQVLPAVMRRKLKARGLSVMNLLPTPGVRWDEMMDACLRDDVPRCVVEFGEYYNRVLIQGQTVEEARVIGAKLRKSLRGIGSRIAEHISVRGV